MGCLMVIAAFGLGYLVAGPLGGNIALVLIVAILVQIALG